MCYLNTKGTKVHDANLGGNITQDTEFHAVIEGGIMNQVGDVDLKEIDMIDDNGGDDLMDVVGLLEEARDSDFVEGDAAVHDSEVRLTVSNDNLVWVSGREEKANGEGERGRRGGN